MDNFNLEGRPNTPSVNLNSATGLLKFFGRSIPENPIKFYEPIEKWVENFIKTNPLSITFQIHLDYLNTHSTECVLILIKKLEAYQTSSKSNVKVIWNYDEDDEDMDDLGRDLSTLTTLPFEYIEVPEAE